MIETHMNIFDVVVIAIMVLSCIFAFFRGFVREVLSLGAWVGAAVITIYYFPDATEMLKPHFKSAVGAAGVATLGIYTITLIGFSMINLLIMKFVKSGNDVGMLDNMMGFIFGVVRGGFIVSLGYFMITIALPEKEYPDWLKHSYTRPYVEMGAIKIAKAAPPYLREISTLQKRADAELAAEKNKSPDEIDDPVEHADTGNGAGYSRKEQDDVNRFNKTSPSR